MTTGWAKSRKWITISEKNHALGRACYYLHVWNLSFHCIVRSLIMLHCAESHVCSDLLCHGRAIEKFNCFLLLLCFADSKQDWYWLCFQRGILRERHQPIRKVVRQKRKQLLIVIYSLFSPRDTCSLLDFYVIHTMTCKCPLSLPQAKRTWICNNTKIISDLDLFIIHLWLHAPNTA